MNESVVYYGSDIKLSLTIDFGEISADSVPFDVVFQLGSASLTLHKEQLIRVDEKNYLACIKHPNTKPGVLKAYVKAQLPDYDFEDHIQNVVTPIDINVRII